MDVKPADFCGDGDFEAILEKPIEVAGDFVRAKLGMEDVLSTGLEASFFAFILFGPLIMAVEGFLSFFRKPQSETPFPFLLELDASIFSPASLSDLFNFLVALGLSSPVPLSPRNLCISLSKFISADCILSLLSLAGRFRF